MIGTTMTPAQKTRAIAVLTDAMNIIKALPDDHSCHGCDYFTKGDCAKWGAPVPEEAQAAGCDEWIEDIPF